MAECLFHFAFIGPGGPEFLVVMLVLLMLFGAKDAPRILRKLNEIINQIRNTADGFKREVMYGDLHADPPAYDEPTEHGGEYDLEAEFQTLEEDVGDSEDENEGEDGDVRKA